MTQFVRFTVDDKSRFSSLQSVFDEIKAIKNLDFPTEDQPYGEDDLDVDYDLNAIRSLMPADVQSNFVWPSGNEIADHQLPKELPIAISPPGTFLGTEWSLVRILDLIDCCEYSLDRCLMTSATTAEMHVVAWSYPYGGLNALMALIEGFGFKVVGANECGAYESLDG